MEHSRVELGDSREVLPEVPAFATSEPLPDGNPCEATEAETDAEATHETSLPDFLKQTRDLIQRRRASIARNTFDIANQIAAVARRLPRSHLRALLVSEFGIDRADVTTYLKMSDALRASLTVPGRDARTQSDVLQESGASFSVLKALVAAPEAVRADAVERIGQGNFIHSSEVTAMRRRHAEALNPQLAEERRHQKALRSAALNKAQSDLSSFREGYLPFVQSLIDLFNEGIGGTVDEAALGRRRAELIETAQSCLSRFRALFDVSSLPSAWDGYFEQHEPDAARLSRAHDSLIDLAGGVWKAVDLESGGPCDREDTLVDRSKVESLIWLFEGNGLDESQLKARSARSPAVPKAEQPSCTLRSLEICAGAGGQALGLHAAGFRSIGTFERNEDAAASLRANGLFGVVHTADITKVDFRRYHGKVDLVAGGVIGPHGRVQFDC